MNLFPRKIFVANESMLEILLLKWLFYPSYGSIPVTGYYQSREMHIHDLRQNYLCIGPFEYEINSDLGRFD